jgi:hypothetical protein
MALPKMSVARISTVVGTVAVAVMVLGVVSGHLL